MLRSSSMTDYTPPPAPLIPAVPAARPDRLGWMRRSLTFRAVVVGILVLLLLIPLSMVQELIDERAQRKSEAETNISQTWGGPQTILGPVIDVPYEVPVQATAPDGSRLVSSTEIHYAHFLPEELKAEAVLDPFEKHRGIYDVAVYGSRTKLSGSFAPLTPERLATGYPLQWDKAKLVLGITDLRSIKEQVSVRIAGRTVQFEPGLPDYDLVANGLSADFPLDSMHNCCR